MRGELWAAALVGAAVTVGCSTDRRDPVGHAESALVGDSKFEIDENAVPVAAGNREWSTVIGQAGFSFATDLAKDASDESFGQGSKEDSTAPQIVNGAIPPNKNDFTRFYVYTETINDHLYFAFAWFRTNDTGTSNQDVELNRVPPTEEGKGTNNHRLVTHRSTGDVLITFDTHSNAPENVDIGMAIWGPPTSELGCIASNASPCWRGKKPAGSSQYQPIPLTGITPKVAEGEVNTTSITDVTGAGGSGGTLTARTFGEANIDLTAAGVVDTTKCSALNSAFLKSRSSDSFSAELKDYVPPIGISTGSCSVDLLKQDDAGNNLSGITFGLYKDVGTIGECPLSDKTAANEYKLDGTHVQCTTGTDGKCTTPMSVEDFGNYCVYEMAPKDGYAAPTTGFPVTVASGARHPTVSTTIINPRLFKIITFVCQQSTKTLYASRITVDGTTVTSLGTGALPSGLTESVLCDTLNTGAIFSNKQKGSHVANDCIPLTSGLNACP